MNCMEPLLEYWSGDRETHAFEELLTYWKSGEAPGPAEYLESLGLVKKVRGFSTDYIPSLAYFILRISMEQEDWKETADIISQELSKRIFDEKRFSNVTKKNVAEKRETLAKTMEGLMKKEYSELRSLLSEVENLFSRDFLETYLSYYLHMLGIKMNRKEMKRYLEKELCEKLALMSYRTPPEAALFRALLIMEEHEKSSEKRNDELQAFPEVSPREGEIL